MFDPDEIAVRQAGLARHMSERLSALAERVFVQAETASEPEAVQAAALMVEKLYRGVRLSLAFEARVAHDHRRATREVEAEALKVRAATRQRGIERIKQAVSTTFIAEYETDRETSGDPDKILHTLVRQLAAVGDAVTASEAAMDPDGDIAAQVEGLRNTALMIADIKALEAPDPSFVPQTPPRRAANGLRWGGSGSG